jgi:hypothetical protein
MVVKASNCGLSSGPAQSQLDKCALQKPSGYDFTPLVLESHGRLCTASHVLLNKLGGLAGDKDGVTKGVWIEGSLPQLSVALVLHCAREMTSRSVRTCIPSGALLANIPHEEL